MHTKLWRVDKSSSPTRVALPPGFNFLFDDMAFFLSQQACTSSLFSLLLLTWRLSKDWILGLGDNSVGKVLAIQL